MIEELEDQLKVERSRLRTLITEQNQAEQQREAVVLQLRRTETVRTLSSQIETHGLMSRISRI